MYEILRIYGGDGTAVPIINKSDFEGLETEIPPLPEQKAITAVLSSLDDKIDLLHRQNKTLESLAQTLFRHWFIDNAQDDWEVRKLKEVCEIKNGYAFKSETYQDDGYKIIRTLNFENNLVTLNKLTFISQELAKDYEKYNLERFDFLLVMVGASLGNFAIVTKDILPALQNQNMWCFRAKKSISQHYLNFALRDIITENLHSASGSARQFFQKSAFYEFEIVVPPAELIQKFTQSAEGIFSKIELNQHQIRTLEKLRDTLLPKLMSGEVRVRL
jgi:type I restriction enzyme S subunit